MTGDALDAGKEFIGHIRLPPNTTRPTLADLRVDFTDNDRGDLDDDDDDSSPTTAAAATLDPCRSRHATCKPSTKQSASRSNKKKKHKVSKPELSIGIL